MRTLRLLTIGNSFADNALKYLQAIAASTGEVAFEVGRANLGGCSLEKHYLIGAVWFECLTGQDIHAAPFAPPEIDGATLAFLRDTAHRAVHAA